MRNNATRNNAIDLLLELAQLTIPYAMIKMISIDIMELKVIVCYFHRYLTTISTKEHYYRKYI